MSVKNGPPPRMSGAVDLGAVKAAGHQRAQQERMQLIQAGLLCQCGELIRSQGVQAILLKDIPGQGPVMGQANFHSRECPALLGLMTTEPPMALRALPAIEWLKEPDVALPEEKRA
jgi:hypothetical protein